MTALASFTLFPKLPTEIRLRIWRTKACHPRTIELFVQPETSPSFSCLHCRNPVPEILHVCHESRWEGRNSYFAFERKQCDPFLESQSQPQGSQQRKPYSFKQSYLENIYFSYARDTLYFSRWTSFIEIYFSLHARLELEQTRMIKSVAFSIGNHQLKMGLDSWFPQFQRRLPFIENVILVLPTDDDSEGMQDARWKEMKLTAPQCERPASEMIAALHTWQIMFHGTHIQLCFTRPDSLESFVLE
jgi:hypothetical protein